MLIKVKAASRCDRSLNFDDETDPTAAALSMDKKRYSARVIRLTLMVSSIVLLLLFQLFWLASSYEQTYIGFHRETSALLRSTVFSIRDSLFLRDLDHLFPEEPDSGDRSGDNALLRFPGSARPGTFRVDVRRNVKWPDSLNVVSDENYHSDSGAHKNFVIRIRTNDTLSTRMLHDHYKVTIANANYTTPFIIRHIVNSLPLKKQGSMESLDLPFAGKDGGNGTVTRRALSISYQGTSEQPFHRFRNAFDDTLITEKIPLGPIHAYAAIFPNMRSNILKRIAPQLLFSILLSAITVAAFVIIYRNLRAQEQVVEMKNDFISNVTHELKTPIATVSVALEALKDFNALRNPAKTAEYLTIAQHELNRLALMTDKILKTSVFEERGVTFVTEVVQLDQIVRQVTDSLTVVLEKKRMNADIGLTGKNFQIEGSEMHLTNVVYNLLDNAIKYSPDNTSITIRLLETGDNITLSVRDRGIGIDPVYHKKIFEKFFRVPAGDVHNTRGYGLGLNYVSGVVRSHKGTIRLESAPGLGSTITIQLPKKHVH